MARTRVRRKRARRLQWRSPRNLLRARLNSSAGLRALSARRKPSPVAAEIERLLAADRPAEPADIERLALGPNIADAVSTLHFIIRQPNEQGYQFAALLFEEHVAPLLRLRRFAIFFRLIRAEADHSLGPITTVSVESIRKLARTKPAARLTLAAFGDINDWVSATRRERAAYLAGAIGRTHRDRTQ